jgi:hypothetical protein
MSRPALTQTVVLAEKTNGTPDHFTLQSFPIIFACAPEQVETELTPSAVAALRAEVERRGLEKGSLLYELNGRRRAVNLDTGAVRWANEERPKTPILDGSTVVRKPG